MLKQYDIVPPQRKAIDTPVACEHKYVLSKRTYRNGQIAFENICTVCGTSGARFKHIELTQEEKKTAHDVDENKLRLLREAWNKGAWQGKSQSDDWWEWYSLYLQSAIWSEKRDAV
jgi:hypothetical protein